MTTEQKNVQMSMPPQNEQIVVHLGAGDAFKLQGMSFEDLKFDILGTDVIIADIANNSKLIFPGLTALLFDEESAPEFFVGDLAVSPDMLLGQIGAIRNVTQQDFLTFTSLEVNQSQQSDDNKTGAAEASDQQSEQQETVTLELTAALNNLQMQKQVETPEDSGIGNDDVDTIVQGKSKLKLDGKGLPLAPPIKKGSSDQNSSQTSSAEEDNISNVPDNSTRTVFDFDINLLQLQEFSDTGNNAIEGGGGNILAAFNPINSQQFSTNTIDTISDSSVTTIYADDPDHFSEGTNARVIQVAPNLPIGFNVTEISLSIASGSWPAGFDVAGLIDDSGDNVVTLAATETAGVYTVQDASGLTLNALDNLDIVFTYDAGVTEPVFDVQIDITAEFDPGSGYDTPGEPVQDFTINQKFMVKDVTSAADLVETDGGDTVMVLSTMPNKNVINTSDSDMEVYGAGGIDEITAGAGDDVIYGSLGDDVIDGGGNGADSALNAQGEAGDTLDFSAKDTAINVDMSTGATSTLTVDSGTYTQSITGIENISGSTENDTIFGDANDNIIRGNGGADVLSGNDGDDILDGGPGSISNVGDTASYAYVIGGTGVTVDLDGSGSATVNVAVGDVDTLIEIENIIGSDFADTFLGSVEDNIFNGGAGTDTVSYYEAEVVQGVVVDLGAIGNGYGVATDDGGGSGGVDTLISIERVIGSQFVDNITGDGLNNTIFGGLGSDILNGGGGTDTAGFYELAGGFVTLRLDLPTVTATYSGDGSVDQLTSFERYILTVNDDIVYNSSGDDYVDAGTGTGDTINYSLSDAVYVNLTTTSAVDYGGGAGIAIGTDTLIGFEHIIGSDYDDVLAGNSADNNIQGGAGNDTLMGLAGDDTLDGGAGTNTVSYESASGGVTATMAGTGAGQDGNGGTDTFTNIQNLTGSGFTDTLTGDGGNNVIHGGNGDDIIYGGGGDDTLTGGSGNHDFYGGAGDDTINGGTGWFDVAYYHGAAGAITVDFTDPLPNIQVTDDGDGGSDTLIEIEGVYGSNGADTFIMDDVAIVLDGYVSGSDFADYSNMTGQNLTVRLDNVSFQIFGGSGSVQRLNSIESVTTADGNDTIYTSNDRDETVNTGAGNDYVYGSSLDDTINLGTGNNTIDYSRVSADITSVTLDANGDGTILRGGNDDTVTGLDNIVGGIGNDAITGSSAANTLYGFSGDDILIGGLGDDFMDGGDQSSSDQVYYAGRTDAVSGLSVNMSVISGATDAFGNGGYYAVTLTGLGETDHVKNVERFSGTNYDDTITGDSGLNRIYGEGGNDTINGGAGADYLVGGDGDDTVNGGDDADIIVGGAGTDIFDGGSGVDRVTYANAAGAVDVDLGANTASDDGDGASDTLTNIEDVIGSDYDDTIVGDDQDNTLEGGDGNDILAGGEGSDILRGQGDVDTVDYSLESGGGGITIDLSVGSNNATDTFGDTDTVTEVENVIGTAQVDIITGSSADNTLEGGGDNDTIHASGGNDTIRGQAGAGDIVDYTGHGSAISGGLISAATTGTIIKATGGTDSITGIEIFELSDLDDTLSISTSAVSSLAAESIRGNAGDDTISLSEFGSNLTDEDIDGDTLANIFSDIEEIDLTSVTLTGPDEFDLTESDVLGIVGAGGTLTLNISSGFSLNLDDSGDGSGNLFSGTSNTFALTNGTSVEVQVV